MKKTFQRSDIQTVAKAIIDASPSKQLCFYGEMGAGKTTLIKALVKELGAVDSGSSPTFGLVNEYHDVQGQLLGYHFDFYRLEDEIEALDMGLEDYLNSDAWIFMEWPEKIKSLLPEDIVPIFLHFVDENTRSVELNIR
ncbi:tRNA (adenosine(37)-N6)-threonylcarbamoyltransferase complex ATPase subunit type 1 TsaE [Muricauda sp. CAU 1633]|uniref:tRNA (adenosine(37)-N6)-threonylcarbamoyltransferase complex ATPase subunit type 1 TsaE n=1 Tax=Allomuricauda sp. CAU 1633 TaxID=2816036 RepID=UPI001A8E7BA1|nr:tRNA (adenosine(37)-N6)-threonylcarbamoyltransferase complex ATPase subunit type 1 TsaE [Muricauda sp. CAU 1633]MBO0323295.1 tRNA (adenosine(37)-N6)-threonylcarbamoyltransferase complex ATPase subunit type 1 TsaE [Muricauda sp. CAU 1633]